MPLPELFTIGHSTHTPEKFLTLLQQHNIAAIGDVRSSPFSAWTPQFNRQALETTLRDARIQYVFLGDELGARRGESQAYVNGVAQYDKVATLPLFKTGLDRIRKGIRKFRLALMCAEKDPLECHRTILVCRHLRGEASISHILEDGSLERHASAEARLMKEERVPIQDLFMNTEELITRAYEQRGGKIAYRENEEEKDARG